MTGKLLRLLAVLVAVIVVAGACGSDDDGDDGAGGAEAPTEDQEADAGGDDADGGEDGDPQDVGDGDQDGTAVGGPAIVLAGIDFESGGVTIANVGSEPADPAGMFVCNRPTYVPVPGGELAPGATATVALSELGADASSGEVALYVDQSFDSAESMVSYVRWGTPDEGRASIAVEAGLWEEGAALDAGASAFLSTAQRPAGPGDWLVE